MRSSVRRMPITVHEYACWTSLVVAILNRAAKDYQIPKYRDDVREFLLEPWCATYCNIVDVSSNQYEEAVVNRRWRGA